jgi:hypothetical protein
MRRRITTLWVVVLGVALAACEAPDEDARVHIVYDQVANFSCDAVAPDSPGCPTDGTGMLVLFKILSVTNLGRAATTFTFDQDRVVAVARDRTSKDGLASATENRLLAPAPMAHGTTLAAQETRTDAGCFIKLVSTDDPSALKSARINVLYPVRAPQPVTMTRSADDASAADVSTSFSVLLPELCTGS